MKLLPFRVESFRSVADSGWIDTNDVTALIGTNESGKSNLLLPLWKLNPAKEGEIYPTADFPRKQYADIRNMDPKPVFIEAIFETDEDLREQLYELTDISKELLGEIMVSRRLDSSFEVDFPKVPSVRTIPSATITELLESALSEISAMMPMKSEESHREEIIAKLEEAKGGLSGESPCSKEEVHKVCQLLRQPQLEGAPKTSSIIPRFERLKAEIEVHKKKLSKPHPSDSDDVKNAVIERLPKFVYYSNYGNLDSEIYLPHVIQNLERDDLGQKEIAKTRTLKVLFEFVQLQPAEILELGRDVQSQGQNPTQDQVEQSAEKKKERSILLQSASSRMTQEFRKWWKQGDYRFRFEADGDHFRIWVADDRRPEEVELEGRSTGLQWFLSFYLVFLVESADTHHDCILLLDEPGLSLHPLAQRDLSEFFDGLAAHNQLLYTTHSPFMVDADRLDRARKVYVADDGTSKATANLGDEGGGRPGDGAGYTVHAALGITVAESLLVGCRPVIVEGPSDQHYFTAIKTVLIRQGQLNPGRELVFPPAGGAKGAKAVASILMGRDDSLPVVMLDSDSAGHTFARDLRKELYSQHEDSILQVHDYITGLENAEVEDLLPPDIFAKAVDKQFRQTNEEFGDFLTEGTAIVQQVEKWAAKEGVTLVKSWKVLVAVQFKRILLEADITKIDNLYVERWTKLFADFQARSG